MTNQLLPLSLKGRGTSGTTIAPDQITIIESHQEKSSLPDGTPQLKVIRNNPLPLRERGGKGVFTWY
jgi:hypothetical protein